MSNVIKDVSTLTTINEKYINRLVDISYKVINDTLVEDMLKGEGVTELSIGIGTIYINHEGEEIKFKFIPSAKLRENVVNTIEGKRSNLEYVLESNLVEKFIETYKDII